MNDVIASYRRSLRDIIEHHAERLGRSMRDLTVMKECHDPYRLDTPAGHRDGQWFAAAWATSGARRPLHLRGIHYALVSIYPQLVMPSGEPYINSWDCWEWLVEVASKKARWLDYVKFEDIIDQRNDDPLVFDFTGNGEPKVCIEPGGFYTGSVFDGYLNRFNVQLPQIETAGFHAEQEYRLVFIGEKSSLDDVLRPIAQRHRCELILPTGNLSDSHLHGLAKRAADDSRACRVFYFSDFDPAGHHMPIEVSRKLQAMADRDFPDLDLQTRRCALTVDQVRALNLPSTPLKDTERRADKWRERYGQEQTEIDALGTLRPDVLRQIAMDAIKPYYDYSLALRVEKAEDAARKAAEEAVKMQCAARQDRIEALDVRIDAINDRIREMNEELSPVLEALEVEGDAIMDEVTQAAAEVVDAYEADLPEPECDGDIDEPLFDSTSDWVEQTLKLKDAKI